MSCRVAGTNVVFGAGNPKAEIMFIGEGSGHDVVRICRDCHLWGRSGELLTKIIAATWVMRAKKFALPMWW